MCSNLKSLNPAWHTLDHLIPSPVVFDGRAGADGRAILAADGLVHGLETNGLEVNLLGHNAGLEIVEVDGLGHHAGLEIVDVDGLGVAVEPLRQLLEPTQLDLKRIVVLSKIIAIQNI